DHIDVPREAHLPADDDVAAVVCEHDGKHASGEDVEDDGADRERYGRAPPPPADELEAVPQTVEHAFAVDRRREHRESEGHEHIDCGNDEKEESCDEHRGIDRTDAEHGKESARTEG